MSGGRRVWPGLLTAAIGLVAVLGVLAEVGGNARFLDPHGTGPDGGAALAALLRDRGIQVERVRSVTDAVPRAGTDGTVFVPRPDRIPVDELGALAGLTVVAVDPGAATLQRLAPGVSVHDRVDVRERLPGCGLPPAVVAGAAELGGTTYDVRGAADTCYGAGGAPTLVARAAEAGELTLIGTAAPFRNDALDRTGNAALALGLLSRGRAVVWLLPPSVPAAAGGGQRSLADLLPDRLVAALGQLLVALALFALWRGRRLGPVVPERLPVVVRAAETVEGRARLYRATGARDRAAAALRAGTRSRLGTRLGFGLGVEPPAAALVDAVSPRTAATPDRVGLLLYGAPPELARPDLPDDAALVRLATDLDDLETEVRRR